MSRLIVIQLVGVHTDVIKALMERVNICLVVVLACVFKKPVRPKLHFCLFLDHNDLI